MGALLVCHRQPVIEVTCGYRQVLLKIQREAGGTAKTVGSSVRFLFRLGQISGINAQNFREL